MGVRNLAEQVACIARKAATSIHVEERVEEEGVGGNGDACGENNGVEFLSCGEKGLASA